MVHYDTNAIFQLLMILRIVRAVVRVMEVFDSLRTPFEVFVRTIPSLQRLFFPYVIIALFYSLTGMALYSGSTHWLCGRQLSSGVWEYKGYCGSSSYTCPLDLSCV